MITRSRKEEATQVLKTAASYKAGVVLAMTVGDLVSIFPSATQHKKRGGEREKESEMREGGEEEWVVCVNSPPDTHTHPHTHTLSLSSVTHTHTPAQILSPRTRYPGHSLTAGREEIQLR